MRKTVFFHGSIKHLLPEPVEVEANSAVEAMRAIVMMHPHLQHFEKFEDRHTVQIAGFDTPQALRAVTEIDEIHVMPAMIGSGGGNGGFVKIAIGVALIAVALITFQPYICAPGLTGLFAAATSTTAGSLMVSMGTSLILGGLLSFLSPSPRRDTGLSAQADPAASKYLGVGQNTVKIGTRIPVLYGKTKCYGHYISFDIAAKDVAV